MDRNKKYATAISFKIEAKESDYLYVKDSQIPFAGKGLFVAIKIYKDEVISIFKGEILSNSEAKNRAKRHENKYFINLPNGKIMDSMHVNCFAKFANDAKGNIRSKLINNAKISLDEEDHVCLIALRNIKKGEEIFCNYGNNYWKPPI